MSLPRLFVTGVRLQLFEAAGQLTTQVVRGYQMFGATFDTALVVDFPAGCSGYIGFHSPPTRRAGYAVLVDPFQGTKSIVYATRADMLTLTSTAAKMLLCPPRLGSVTVWYTPAAERECSNTDINRHEARLLDEHDGGPNVADLFAHDAFWSYARACRARPSLATAVPLASVLDAHGFNRLAQGLRDNPSTLRHVLPRGATRCPRPRHTSGSC